MSLNYDIFRARSQPRWTAEELDAALGRLVGRRIREARKTAGDTQKDLACAVGVSRPQIVNIEHGRGANALTTLAKCASALRVELASLIPSSSEVVAECVAARKARRRNA